MPMAFDQIAGETRQLPQDARAGLAGRILLGAHGGTGPHVDGAWKREIRRRTSEIQGGRAGGIPLEDAQAEAHGIAGR